MDDFDDFDLLLPQKIFNESGDFLDDAALSSRGDNTDVGLGGVDYAALKAEFQDIDNPPTGLERETSSSQSQSATTHANGQKNTRKRCRADEPSKVDVKSEKYGELFNQRENSQPKKEKISYEGMTKEEIAEAKKNRRRKQIARASRLSRARRKQEMNQLRDENKKLREERSNHLLKICKSLLFSSKAYFFYS